MTSQDLTTSTRHPLDSIVERNSATTVMDDIESLRRLLREEQRRREEEQRRREEEQRRREEAEELVKVSLPQALPQYLEACHSLSAQIRVVTDPSSTTQGDTTDPIGRIFPRRIVPWNDFAEGQEKIWESLSVGPFSSEPVFPSSHQLEYVASVIHPISSETGLRYFELLTVENAVQKLVDKVYDDPVLRARLGIRGSVTFESHTNLPNDPVDTISESIQHMSIDGVGTGVGAAVSNVNVTRAFRRAKKGKGGSADQFCIYRTSDGRNVPALAIEYKAPHKLTRDEVVTGLHSEIQPERDVINKGGEGFPFTSRSLAAAVITQLFSYMIAKGIRFGYVCTGEVFIFLHIPDDPTIVYYYVSVPNVDVSVDDENRLHRTAVAQVFAFVLRAVGMPPPPESWYDRAVASLDTWDVEYDDVLKRIPQSIRKQPAASPYKPQSWKGFVRSPIRTRSGAQSRAQSGCRPPNEVQHKEEDSSEDESSSPPSPSLGRSLPFPLATQRDESAKTSTASTVSTAGAARSNDNNDKSGRRKMPIEDRPYCTQKCLLGLARGGLIDWKCPNAPDHGQQHLDRAEFCRLIRVQLAQDRGPNADAAPLYVSGAIGSLFKVRLSAHGYTLVAKGVERRYFSRLRHENDIYDRLQSIQGCHIPVCLGTIDLMLPYYYDGGVFERFMFLGWAGRPLFQIPRPEIAKRPYLSEEVSAAFKAIHALQVLHGDTELRNILYDVRNRRLMVLDFERAILRNCDRSNLKTLKRKREYSKLPSSSNECNKEIETVVNLVKELIDKMK